jgi:hypothetical protein
LHIKGRHHVLPLHQVWPHSVHNDLDVFDTIAFQQPRDTVSITESRNVRGSNKHCLFRRGNGSDKPSINTCKVNDNQLYITEIDAYMWF